MRPHWRNRLTAVLRWSVRRYLYPWHGERPRRDDPTYGRIDRDIQWRVNDEYAPSSIGQRLAMELNLQAARDAQTP